MDDILFNGQLSSSNVLPDILSNRGFLYGDGFFETMVIRDKKIFFLSQHMQRAQRAIQTLQLKDTALSLEQLKDNIQTLWKHHLSPDHCVIKWIVWRNSEGLYSPSSPYHAYSLLQLKPFRSVPDSKARVCIAQSVHNHVSCYSGFKRLSAMPYVLAGLEKNTRSCDDMILLDLHGHLSEANSSSLFWIKDDVVYTPSLDTGCIDGITKQALLKYCSIQKIKVQEVLAKPSELTSDCTLFTGNVTGLSLIKQIEDLTFNSPHPMYHHLKQALLKESVFYENLETTN